MPQAIQRQLEEVAEKQRDVEERGVTIEKTIRGETDGGEESHLRPVSLKALGIYCFVLLIHGAP